MYTKADAISTGSEEGLYKRELEDDLPSKQGAERPQEDKLTRAAKVQQLTASCGSLLDSNSFAVPAPPSCAAHLPLHKQPLGCKQGGAAPFPQ